MVPLKTESGSGPNSFHTPTIGVSVRRCSWFFDRTTLLVIKAGEVKAPSSGPDVYQYFAKPHIATNVCKNKCAYGYSCNPALPQCPGPGTSPNCDTQVTSIVNNMCDATINGVTGQAVGICAFRSRYTGYEKGFVTAWNNFLKFLRNLPLKDLFPGPMLLSFIAGKVPDIPDGFILLDCSPVPLAPLPPPFCAKSFKSQSNLNILRTCYEGEKPVLEIPSTSTKASCAPQFPSTSSFLRPCVRISEYNPVSNKNIEKANNYYAKNAKEMLYSSDQVKSPNRMPYADLFDIETGSMITNKPLEVYGYNNVNSIDICGTINTTDGSIDTTQKTFIDKLGNKRVFQLGFACDDPEQPGKSTCGTPIKNFSQRKIYVYEIIDGKQVLQDYFDRPEMQKPSVSICTGSFNDKTEACINVKSDAGTVEFSGPMTECSDTQADQDNTQEKRKLCTLQRDNAGGFQAILTNRIYRNADSILDNTKSNCYSNRPPFGTSSRRSCNCAIDEFGICDKKVVGAERLCLFGYGESYISLAKPWCKDSKESGKICNRVLTNTVIASGGDPSNVIPLLDVQNRRTPPNNEGPSLSTSAPYHPPSTDTENANAGYRVPNPIELGLCVDAYTISFNKECKSKDGSDFPTQACTQVKNFCSKTDSVSNAKNRGLNTYYKNFDICQDKFKICLDPKTPDDSMQQLIETSGNGREAIQVTCGDMRKFVSP
jgi:hypothetical protein